MTSDSRRITTDVSQARSYAWRPPARLPVARAHALTTSCCTRYLDYFQILAVPEHVRARGALLAGRTRLHTVSRVVVVRGRSRRVDDEPTTSLRAHSLARCLCAWRKLVLRRTAARIWSADSTLTPDSVPLRVSERARGREVTSFFTFIFSYSAFPEVFSFDFPL